MIFVLGVFVIIVVFIFFKVLFGFIIVIIDGNVKLIVFIIFLVVEVGMEFMFEGEVLFGNFVEVFLVFFVVIFINYVEDIILLVEIDVWVCIWVVIVGECVNVIVGNFDCILDGFLIFIVIFGVVGVDGVVVLLFVVIGRIVFFIT